VYKIIKTFGAAGISAVILIAVFLLPIQANAQLEIKSADGKSSIKFGILGHFQAESLTTPDGSATSKDLYLRRFRLCFGGNIMENLSFFADTESPNLGKVGNSAAGATAKGSSDAFLSDAYATYSFSNEFKVEAGMILLPVSHHAEQSSASLLGIDFGPYTFIWNDPTSSRLGRDYGMQVRGYLGNNHFEYRLGVFQGLRGANSTNPYRITARAVYYPFQHESGFFYSGTYFGDKKVLAIGMSLDHQGDYNAYGADIFVDYPLASKDVITAQLDYTNYDGGDFITAIPKQNVIFAEAGYYFQALKTGPFVQVNYDNMDSESLNDKHFMQVGLAYYVKGQTLNIKLGVGQFGGDNLEDQTQLLLRIQAFIF
jgi:hypothetical protein